MILAIAYYYFPLAQVVLGFPTVGTQHLAADIQHLLGQRHLRPPSGSQILVLELHLQHGLFDFRPAVFEGAGTVEDQMLGSRVAVGAEVAHALELVAGDAVRELTHSSTTLRVVPCHLT